MVVPPSRPLACGAADVAITNLQNAAFAGLATGARGFLNADWGDNGHLQPLSAATLGLVAGADLGWNADADVSRDRVVQLLARHALRENAPLGGAVRPWQHAQGRRQDPHVRVRAPSPPPRHFHLHTRCRTRPRYRGVWCIPRRPVACLRCDTVAT